MPTHFQNPLNKIFVTPPILIIRIACPATSCGAKIVMPKNARSRRGQQTKPSQQLVTPQKNSLETNNYRLQA